MKIIATIDTADFSDCVNTGWRFTLYSDGHVAAESVSRWQGSRSGERYITNPGFVNLKNLGEGPDFDAEAKLTEAMQDIDPEEDRSFRQTRIGYIIR